MVLVAYISLTPRRHFSSGQTFWSFCVFVVVCLLDLHLILLRRAVQHCVQSDYDYGQLHEALKSGTFQCIIMSFQ